MTQLYEGMFLLDNQAVRADWAAAKAVVTALISKHGGRVQTARRWDERRLSYSIRGRKRGTYLLAHFEQDAAGSQTLRRDLDIEERILRYLILAVEALPAGELEASKAELESGFSVPPPPPDDEPAHEEPAAAEPAPAEEPAEEEVAVVAEGADAQEGKV
jgi:small subunit ribosomal protein S6